MFNNLINSKYFIGYSFALLLLTLVIYNYSPSPRDGVTDDETYFKQVRVLEKYGYFEGFDKLAKNYLKRQKNMKTKTSSPRGHHPLRVGRITLHYIAIQFNNTIFSGTYLSLLFYILLGLLLFLFVRQYWDEYMALLIALASMTAPMLMGFSARALMESQYYFFMMLMVFSCIHFIINNNRGSLILFIVTVILGISFKETISLFFPFMVGMILLAKFFYNPKITHKQIILAVVIPVFALGVIYIFIFGFQNLLDIATYQLERHLVSERADYHLKEKNGPWFQYLIDFFVLSPITSILFFLGIGYLLATDKISLKHQQNAILLFFLFFFIYALGTFSLLIKHVRYALFLSFVYRLFVVIFLASLTQKYIKNTNWRMYSLAAMVLIIIGLDMKTYQHFFVELKMKNVWNRGLMQSRSFFKGSAEVKAVERSMTAFFMKTAERQLEADNNEMAIEYAKNSLIYRESMLQPHYILCVAYYRNNDYEVGSRHCRKISNMSLEKRKDLKKWKKQKSHATKLLKRMTKRKNR